MLLTLLYVGYAILGIGIIIFVHELGHFLAAKKVGVRVERFCIGFDPPYRGRNLRIISFRRGETEYALGVIPFGGYVKMAGESAVDPEKTGASDELMSKSVGARALVFVAGAAMNIVSAFFFFIVAFSVGVQFTKPEVGALVTGSPAWNAGIQPGDRIAEIDGKPVIEFHELMVSVALGKRSEPIHMVLERPQGDQTTKKIEINIRPRWNPASGFSEIGVMPGNSNVLGEVEPNSAAARAGLREGDRIVGLRAADFDFTALPTSQVLDALEGFSLLRPERPIELHVLRAGEEKRVEFVLAREKGKALRKQIGIIRGEGNVARGIRQDSEARKILNARDRVLRINDKTVTTVHWLTILDLLEKSKKAGDKSLHLEILGADGAKREVTVDGDAFLRWDLGAEIDWASHMATVASIELDAALAAGKGLREGDTLLEINGEPCYSPDEIETLLERNAAAAAQAAGDVSLLVQRDGNAVSLKASRAALAEASGIVWQTLPPLGAVTEDGPADKAGLRAGDTVLAVEGKHVRSWTDLTQAVSAVKPGTGVDVSWRTPDGETKKGTVIVGLEALETLPAFAPVLTTVRAGILESFALGARRTVVVTKWVFLTLRSLFRREVSAKNLQGPIGIAHVLTKVSEQGIGTLIYFLAIISINLGLFNLLPFPILDGGHIFFLLIEKIKGSPVDIRVQEWATNIAFLLIISLAVFVTFNDLSRLFN